MAEKKIYDAFLSHNSKDKPFVEQLARLLEENENLTVWLDNRCLVPGDRWQEDLENALEQSRCCVVFVGANGLGNWQNEEMRAALDDMVSQKSIRVVLVLLPKVNRSEKESELPRFLRRLTWVDFKAGIDDEHALDLLVCGIKGTPPSYRDKTIIHNVCPFKGLEFFREDDSQFFFGREHIVQQMQSYLENHRMLAVIGPSGSGKSSVIRAGLVASLRIKHSSIEKDGVKRNISLTIATPGSSPVEEFSARTFQFAINGFDSSLQRNLKNNTAAGIVQRVLDRTSIPSVIHQGQQDKHIASSDTYYAQVKRGEYKNYLTTDPQTLLTNFIACQYVIMEEQPQRSMVTIDFGFNIGVQVDRDSGEKISDVHYGKLVYGNRPHIFPFMY